MGGKSLVTLGGSNCWLQVAQTGCLQSDCKMKSCGCMTLWRCGEQTLAYLRQTRSYGSVKNSLLVSDGGLCNGDVVMYYVWKLSYARVTQKYRISQIMGVHSVFVGFVTQHCSPSNVCVWSVDTCAYTKLTFHLHDTRHSYSVFTALWCGCSFVTLIFYLHQTLLALASMD